MVEQPERAGSEPPEPEFYDHTIRKPARVGLAILASFLFFAGGQLVKGHFARFFCLWGILVGLVGLVVLSSAVFAPESTVALVMGRGCLVGAVSLWCYQLWDAATRV